MNLLTVDDAKTAKLLGVTLEWTIVNGDPVEIRIRDEAGMRLVVRQGSYCLDVYQEVSQPPSKVKVA